MTITEMRAKRAAAGIAGHAVCRLARLGRTRLSDIECENVTATPEELQRINDAIEQILETRQRLAKFAAEAGMSLAGVRL